MILEAYNLIIQLMSELNIMLYKIGLKKNCKTECTAELYRALQVTLSVNMVFVKFIYSSSFYLGRRLCL